MHIDPKTGEVVGRVRRPYERERVVTVFEGESMTSQDARDLTDINVIVEQYARTGVLPPAKKPPVFADVTLLQGDLTERIMFAQEVGGKAAAAQEEVRRKRSAKPGDSKGQSEPGSTPENNPPNESNSQ